MRLVKSYGAERVEAACGRALEIGARSYSSVNSILKTSQKYLKFQHQPMCVN